MRSEPKGRRASSIRGSGDEKKRKESPDLVPDRKGKGRKRARHSAKEEKSVALRPSLCRRQVLSEHLRKGGGEGDLRASSPGKELFPDPELGKIVVGVLRTGRPSRASLERKGKGKSGPSGKKERAHRKKRAPLLSIQEGVSTLLRQGNDC